MDEVVVVLVAALPGVVASVIAGVKRIIEKRYTKANFWDIATVVYVENPGFLPSDLYQYVSNRWSNISLPSKELNFAIVTGNVWKTRRYAKYIDINCGMPSSLCGNKRCASKIPTCSVDELLELVNKLIHEKEGA